MTLNRFVATLTEAGIHFTIVEVTAWGGVAMMAADDASTVETFERVRSVAVANGLRARRGCVVFTVNGLAR